MFADGKYDADCIFLDNKTKNIVLTNGIIYM